ncbi:hypothetical protein [Methylomagnum sp.]
MDKNTSLEKLCLEMGEIEATLARALAVADLVRCVTTQQGRTAAQSGGLAGTSITEALGLVVDNLREGVGRIQATVTAIQHGAAQSSERGRDD